MIVIMDSDLFCCSILGDGFIVDIFEGVDWWGVVTWVEVGWRLGEGWVSRPEIGCQ